MTDDTSDIFFAIPVRIHERVRESEWDLVVHDVLKVVGMYDVEEDLSDHPPHCPQSRSRTHQCPQGDRVFGL